MEELLASIRKAIHEDIGEGPAPRDAPPFKSSMRELRLKVGEETSAAANEIQELRNRISKNRTGEPFARPVAPAPKPAGFAGILGGEPDRPRRLPDHSPPALMRPSFAEADVRPQEYRYEPARPPPREPEPAYEPPPVYRGDPSVMSADTAAAAGAAFNRLADTILTRATGDRSVEDMTRELLRGMLKQWLDDNLPALVERLVREEIERVARRGR